MQVLEVHLSELSKGYMSSNCTYRRPVLSDSSATDTPQRSDRGTLPETSAKEPAHTKSLRYTSMDMHTLVTRCRSRWTNYALRMEGNSTTRTAIRFTPDGKRRGHPKNQHCAEHWRQSWEILATAGEPLRGWPRVGGTEELQCCPNCQKV